MCVYLGNDENLTYRKQEHVFPAGLGGKQMLEYGVVSDQANEFFSPLELKLMRHSLIALERMMYGPGRRGSHNPAKASKSAINVGLQDDGRPILCYTAVGKPYNIPQFYRHHNEVTISFPSEKVDTEKQIKSFLAALEHMSEKYTFLKSDYIPVGDILVGFFEGIYYVATNSVRPTKACIKKEVQALLENFQMEEMRYGENHTMQSHRLCENSEIARIYAKIAINVLALRKGAEYASHPNFSEIRNWILTGESSTEYFFLPQIQVEPLDYFMKMIPPKAHWCVFVCGNGKLDAIVCLYNLYIRRFTLGELPDGKSFLLDGYICDWENEQEYTIMQFINMLVKTNAGNDVF
ncbi:MAG: hypothetical protein IKK99_01040 [Oscillospiraceae bacterium]|nr:hypothetical protein [Oscillospiraceae bacterium]